MLSKAVRHAGTPGAYWIQKLQPFLNLAHFTPPPPSATTNPTAELYRPTYRPNYRGLDAPHLLQLPRLAQFQLPQEHSQSPTLGSMPGGSRLPLASVVHPPPTHVRTMRAAWCTQVACTVALLP